MVQAVEQCTHNIMTDNTQHGSIGNHCSCITCAAQRYGLTYRIQRGKLLERQLTGFLQWHGALLSWQRNCEAWQVLHKRLRCRVCSMIRMSLHSVIYSFIHSCSHAFSHSFTHWFKFVQCRAHVYFWAALAAKLYIELVPSWVLVQKMIRAGIFAPILSLGLAQM